MSNEEVGGKVKVELESSLKSIMHDHYSCAIKAKHKYRDIFISSLNKNMVDENEEEIDFKTLDIENSNDNDESEINKKDEETLDDLITSKTKEVPVVIID